MRLRNGRTFLVLTCLLLSIKVWTQQGSGQREIPKTESQQPSSSETTPSKPQESQSVGKEQGVFVIRKNVQEVVIHTTVIDQNKRLVTTLDRSAFKVFEDGKAQTITSFRREDIPVALGIV